MSFDQVFLLTLLAVVLALFIWGRIRYDVVAVLALMATALAGIVSAEEVFTGFANPATVTGALVLILSRSLSVSGAVDLISRHFMPPMKNTTAHVATLSAVGALLSTVMNNVGVLAFLMSAALRSAARAKRPAAAILMPLSFATLLGGLVTLIGTPPNLIVAQFRQAATGEPFRMFDFAPVGGGVALVGLAFIALVGGRLMPKHRRAAKSPTEAGRIEAYISEVRVPRDAELIGRTTAEVAEEAARHDGTLVGLVRRDRTIGASQQGETVKGGDVVLIESSPEAGPAIFKALGLKPPSEAAQRAGIRSPLEDEDHAILEAVVQPRSGLSGRTARQVGLAARHDITLIGLSRQGQFVPGRLSTTRMRPGDVLLLEGEADALADAAGELGFLPLSERPGAGSHLHRALLAIALFFGAIAAAVIDLVSLQVGFLAAATFLVLFRVLPVREIYDAIDWPVIVLLGAMIPVGGALTETNTTGLIADAMLNLSWGAPPWVIVTLVLVVTMTLSDVMNNAATAVVMAPIGVTLADRLGISADPMLMAVAVGASCAFLTPLGHQNNTLVRVPAATASAITGSWACRLRSSLWSSPCR